MLFVGDFLCCLRFILPRIPQIFTDFIYSSIRVHPRYLWETPSHPISVLICAICGRFLLLLEIYSPTDSTDFIYPCIRVHLCYLWDTPSHPISVFICDICGSHPLLLEIYSPTDSTDFHRCILRLFSHRFHRFSQILYIPVSVFICAICGRFFRTQYLC